MEVLTFQQFVNAFKDSIYNIQYIFKYLDGKCKTVLIEKEYIDKDYLIDYSLFYSRAFQEVPRFTQRIHYFSDNFDNSYFASVLKNFSKRKTQCLKDAYLGFSVIKPITNQKGKNLLGKTVIKTYPEENNRYIRKFIKTNIRVSLFGIPLAMNSLPFQPQDRRVSACATVSLWISSYALADRFFGVPIRSPYEITIKASEFPSLGRDLPSSGLNIYQITNYIKSLNFDTEYINAKETKNNSIYNGIISDSIRAYVFSDFPIIASLCLSQKSKKRKTKKSHECDARHAVIISGYKYDKLSRKIDQIYVHDDGVGPYARVKSKDGFYTWEYEWNSKYEVHLESFIIPVYPKIRTRYGAFYELIKKNYYPKIEGYGLKPELLLYSNKKLKYEILNKKTIEIIVENETLSKNSFLMKNMPNYVWILRAYKEGDVILDIGFDTTTAVVNKVIFKILYKDI